MNNNVKVDTDNRMVRFTNVRMPLFLFVQMGQLRGAEFYRELSSIQLYHSGTGHDYEDLLLWIRIDKNGNLIIGLSSLNIRRRRWVVGGRLLL